MYKTAHLANAEAVICHVLMVVIKTASHAYSQKSKINTLFACKAQLSLMAFAKQK